MKNIKSSVNGEQLVHLNLQTTYQPGLRKANKLSSVLIHFQNGTHIYFLLQSKVLLKIKTSLQIDTQKAIIKKITYYYFLF